MQENHDELPPAIKNTTLFSTNTELCADSVEWCPHEPHRNYFACANYELTSDATYTSGKLVGKKRFGRVFLYEITREELQLKQTLNTAAVLDLKWCHNKIRDASLLGVVNAEKTLEIYKLDSNLELLTSHTITDDETETLILSLDWSTGKHASDQPQIICSDSKGNVHLFELTDSTLRSTYSWRGHCFEAWSSAFYYWDPCILFTGGDDSMFLKYDVRTGYEAVAKNRSHEAGVTCIHSNSEKEFVVATGSYDGFIRIWDIRKMKQPTNSLKMPGPAWRLKWDPFNRQHLLVACMLGGLHMVSVNEEVLRIVGSFYGHKNIVYGADWSFLNEKEINGFKGEGNRIVASCSFYDRLLCVSKFQIDL